MRVVLSAALIALLLTSRSALALEHASQKVRKLALKRDEIAVVKTAVGIATLIQVPERPTSVVLGDTNAFKVEYLENAITIKPLSHTSKSNLFVYTEGRRFNVSLVTVSNGSADYIVYLESEVPPTPKNTQLKITTPEKWTDFLISGENSDFKISVTKLGRSQSLLMVAFEIHADHKFKFKPEWIWLTQRNKTIPIQDLNLSGVDLEKDKPLSGFLSFKKSDLKNSSKLFFEVKSKDPLKLKLSEVSQWPK